MSYYYISFLSFSTKKILFLSKNTMSTNTIETNEPTHEREPSSNQDSSHMSSGAVSVEELTNILQNIITPANTKRLIKIIILVSTLVITVSSLIISILQIEKLFDGTDTSTSTTSSPSPPRLSYNGSPSM